MKDTNGPAKTLNVAALAVYHVVLLFLCLTTVGCKKDSFYGEPLRQENDGTYRLIISGKDVNEISELSKISLSSLVLTNTSVVDLSPLKDLPLKNLRIYDSPVRDLSAISNTPLEQILISRTDVQSLLPLHSVPLVSLEVYDPVVTNGMDEIFLLDTLLAINHQPAWKALRSQGLIKLLSEGDVQSLSILNENDLDQLVSDDPLAFIKENQRFARRLMLCEWESLSDMQRQIASTIVNNVGTGFVRLNKPRMGVLFLSFMVEQRPSLAVPHGNLAGALKLICLMEGESRIVYERALSEYLIALDLENDSYLVGEVKKNIDFIQTRLEKLGTNSE